MPLDNKEIPCLPIRIWICLSNWKEWRFRKAIDKAAIRLFYTEHHELGAKLMELSDSLWRQAFSKYKN